MTTHTRAARAGSVGRRPLAPRAATAAHPPQSPRPPGRRDPFDRALAWGLGASVVLHILILLFSPLFITVGVPPGGEAGEDQLDPLAGVMRGVVPIATPGAPDVPAPDRQVDAADVINAPAPVETRPSSSPAAGTGRPSESAGESAPRQSVGEALRPGYRDGRLYVNPRALRVEPQQSRHEAYMDHLQARIEAMNDSANLGIPNTDWTTKDGDGRRWGVSPEGIHLGGVTIPSALLPIPRTGTNQDQERVREERRQREEIIRQEADRKRDEALRESREAAERRRSGGGND